MNFCRYPLKPIAGQSSFLRNLLWNKLLLLISLITLSNSAVATIRFVKAGATGTGASWGNASGDLQAIINASGTSDQVWVAGGVYQPALYASFSMKTEVNIYGGFAGTETALNQRNLTLTVNKSTLLGNEATVVYNNGTLSSTTVLDGFTITGGYSADDGGGICNFNNASPIISNCIITANEAYDDGGGMANDHSAPTLINCIFSGNKCPGWGGGVYNYYASPKLTNCLLSGNIAYSFGGGLATESYGIPILTNCTVSGNVATTGGGIASYYGVASIKMRNTIVYGNNTGIAPSVSTGVEYSLVQGLTSTANGNITGTTNPLFVDQAVAGQSTAGDYRLQPCSPLLNKGNNTYYASAQIPNLTTITTDLAALPRFYNSSQADPGAYELQVAPVYASAAGILYVKEGGTGRGSGWDCAVSDLQAAINVAVSGNEIWVAGGTYTPNRRADATETITATDRNNAFVLKEGVKIYGGFAGTETTLTARNLTLTANASILSGDLNADDGANFANISDNSYHVVVSTGNTGAAVLDGFTIRGGNSDGSTSITINGQGVGTNGGGGITCGGSSPMLTHLLIQGNAGRYGAGAFFGSSSAVISNSIMKGNSGFYGGGIMCSSSEVAFTNVLISGNYAVEQGGGMYNEFGSVAPVLTNVTIAGNTAIHGGGGAMYNNLGVPLKIRNSIIFGNNTDIYNNSGTPQIQYSLVQGETSTVNGNITGTTDPLFVAPEAYGLNTGGDYQLQACSPAINAASNTIYSSGQTPDLSAITTNLLGTSRLQGIAADMGIYEFTGSNNGNPGGADLLAISGDVATVTIAGNTLLMATASGCRTVAALLPDASGTAVAGTINAHVWVESTQPSTYVKRHYEITPASNATTATGRVTLYFTQAEFNDFNAVNALKLPTGPGDAGGIANLLIEKLSGTSGDGSGKPGSYTSSIQTIDPADAGIVWNSAFSRWEVSFDVIGFSGFFVKTQTATLPLRLLSFKASKQSGYNKLQWTTAEEINTKVFELERSADGNAFTTIANIAAAGNGNHAYSYDDHAAYNGKIYYRLKMVDVDARFTYSQVIAITSDGRISAGIYPNPATDIVYASVGNALLHTSATLYDANGRQLQTITINTTVMPINIQHLASGIYLLELADGTILKFIKR